MITTVEKLSTNKVKIRFEADAQTLEAGMQKAYLKLRGRINVPGFRKGKAPRKMIENMYGEGFLYEEALEAIFPDAYEAAVKEHELITVDRPSVDIEQIQTGEPLIFSAEVFVRPEVTLGEYKGIEVPKHEHLVTEADVDRKVEEARERVSRMVEVDDRPVQNGDTVELDYAGSVDGVAFAGGTAEHQTLSIGSNQFIPGFKEQMIGMAVGEERDLSVTFPAEYHAEELAGKEAVFHVKVHGIQVKELPAVDDDFVKDVSEFDTVDAYKADIRAKMDADNAEHIKQAFENAAIDAVVNNATIDVPEPMVERQVDRLVRDFEMRLMYQGMRMEDFLRYTGGDMQSVRGQYHEQALRNVKAELVLDAICKAEMIEAAQSEIDAEMQRYAEQGKKSLEEFKQTLSEQDLTYFGDMAKVQKALDLITSSAVPVAEKHDHHDDHDQDHDHDHDEAIEDAEAQSAKAPITRRVKPKGEEA